MTKNKHTKRALLVSVLSLMLCMAMLVGSTFAWFTDSAATAVNTIQAGNLDVALEMRDGENWVNAEGKKLGWLAADGREQNKILWEPGATYKLPDVRIVNNGKLALKYKITINGVDGDAKLLKAIEFTYGTLDVTAEGYLEPGAASGDITITGRMKKDAGNEYQGLSIEGVGITVVATQWTKESDSFNDQYDKDATYPVITDTSWYNSGKETFALSSAGELAGLSKLVNSGESFKGKTITLTENVDLSGIKNWIPIGFGDAAFAGKFDGANHTVSNLTINDYTSAETQANVGLFGIVVNAEISNLTVTGKIDITKSPSDTVVAVGGICGTIIHGKMSNCTNEVTINVKRDANDESGYVQGFVGGIFGVTADAAGIGNTLSLSNCHNKAEITVDLGDGDVAVGGIAGAASPSHIESSCTNSGKIMKNGSVITTIIGLEQ